MSQDTHVGGLLPEFVLGCLDAADEVVVSEHLANCAATCRVDLAAFDHVMDQLAYAAPDASPPDQLKSMLMNRVQPAPTVTRIEPRLSWLEQVAGLWQRVAPAWGVVSLVFIVVLLVGFLDLGRQEDEIKFTSGGMRIISFTSTDAAPSASGTLVISVDGEHGSLVVDGLPALDPAHQYQLWLISDGQRTDGGVFSVNQEGYGVLWIDSEEPLSSFPLFGVTVEPTGGSSGPTGDKVLGGSW